MRILIIGGTRFIGPQVAMRLARNGHDVTLFHRGQTATTLPAAINYIYSDRRDLTKFKSDFKLLAPDVVLDMICYNEREASDLIVTFTGIAGRVVVASSMDVYRAYGCLLGLESGPPSKTRLNEDSPLRETRFPYRAQAKSSDDMAFDYDKIPVEQIVMNSSGIVGTVVRLPAVYGPGDHRAFEYLKRMNDQRRAILLEENHARWRWTRGYVDNVAAAIALAAVDERAAGRIYNVGEPEALTEADWVKSIGRAAKWHGEIVALPKDLMPRHLVTHYDFSHNLDGNTDRIRNELGYSEHVSSAEAIEQTVEWERAHPPEQMDKRRFDYAAEDELLAAIDVNKTADHRL